MTPKVIQKGVILGAPSTAKVAELGVRKVEVQKRPLLGHAPRSEVVIIRAIMGPRVLKKGSKKEGQKCTSSTVKVAEFGGAILEFEGVISNCDPK